MSFLSSDYICGVNIFKLQIRLDYFLQLFFRSDETDTGKGLLQGFGSKGFLPRRPNVIYPSK